MMRSKKGRRREGKGGRKGCRGEGRRGERVVDRGMDVAAGTNG